MCGRYTYYSSEDILKKFGLANSESEQTKLALNLPDNYNVSPGNDMPIIIRGAQEHRLEFANWGLVPSWSKDPETGLKLINARSESLLEKRMWVNLVKSKRCVVPARGFYEWKSTESGKQPYYITLKDSEIVSFAGLYDEWHDDKGNLLVTYCIITTKPNKEMAYVHNRMPAILDKKTMDIWLEPTNFNQDQIDQLLSPAPDGSLKITAVSKKVNNARNNSKDLIYPLD